MYFIDNEHENFYKAKIGQAKIKDVYSKSLIYLLSSNKETRRYFKEIYNSQENEINIEIIQMPWQTSTSLNICRLAFNLFGDITSDNPSKETIYQYTVTAILKNLNIDCCIQALKLRFDFKDAQR